MLIKTLRAFAGTFAVFCFSKLAIQSVQFFYQLLQGRVEAAAVANHCFYGPLFLGDIVALFRVVKPGMLDFKNSKLVEHATLCHRQRGQ